MNTKKRYTVYLNLFIFLITANTLTATIVNAMQQQQKIIIQQNDTINNLQMQINQANSMLDKICLNNPNLCK